MKDVARLAFPAFGVLVAEPLYLLYDFAVVGRLGALALAGLAIGGTVLALVSTQLTFLSYGTTARAARLHGAGDERGAVGEGVQATWVALGVGAALTVVMQLLAAPVVSVLADDPQVADAAVGWLRIGLFGVPLLLIAMAGNGWLRGVQNTVLPLVYVVAGLLVSAVLCPILVHGTGLGMRGSAVANLAGQAITAVLFVGALVARRVPLRPVPSIMWAQLRLGRDLIARSLAFQVCFVSATAVAARFGAAAVAAHQMVLNLWFFSALTLDALAIAAQSLVGAALGAGDTVAARTLAWRITWWSTAFSGALALVFAAGYAVVPRIFTGDTAVLVETGHAWWFFVAILPLGGVAFALDGVLIGAGDAAFLRTATLLSALVGFLPLIWAALIFDWGLAGIWAGLAAFMVLRALSVVARTRSGHWLVTGADRQRVKVES